MKPLNASILSIAPSATLAISSKAKQMAAQGVHVANFSAGEPDFDTPEFIREAAKKALDEGKTRYTPASGLPALRAAIAEKLARENGVECAAENIVVSSGAKHSLALVFQTLLNPGDEVLIPVPYWLSYVEMVKVAGGRSVFVHGTRADGFKISPEDIERAATPRTAAIVINSPANPSGMVYSRDELAALAATATRLGIAIVSDEIYEKMVYDGCTATSVASLSPEIAANTITVNGFSKAFAMTGWRLGYTTGPAHFIKAMGALQSHCASAPNTFAQHAAVVALKEGADSTREMVAAFDQRRQRLYGLLTAIPGVKCVCPQGAFYMLPDISAFGLGSVEFATRLLEEKHAAVVPGVAFGVDRCVRLSYACSIEEIEYGASLIAEFCAGLRK